MEWKKGRKRNCIICDEPNSCTPVPSELAKKETDYYGGYLVAEFIPDEYIDLITAAPEMLEVLKSIENDDNSIPASIWEMRNDAIAKAEGRL